MQQETLFVGWQSYTLVRYFKELKGILRIETTIVSNWTTRDKDTVVIAKLDLIQGWFIQSVEDYNE